MNFEDFKEKFVEDVKESLVFWEIRLIWSIEERAFIKYTSPTYSSYV